MINIEVARWTVNQWAKVQSLQPTGRHQDLYWTAVSSRTISERHPIAVLVPISIRHLCRSDVELPQPSFHFMTTPRPTKNPKVR